MGTEQMLAIEPAYSYAKDDYEPSKPSMDVRKSYDIVVKKGG